MMRGEALAPNKRTENARRHGHQVGNCAEQSGALSDIVNGLVEVRMVEQVEELEAHAELACLPVGDFEILHDGEVIVEESRAHGIDCGSGCRSLRTARDRRELGNGPARRVGIRRGFSAAGITGLDRRSEDRPRRSPTR